MAKKLINSLQINGDKHIIGIPTVTVSQWKVTNSSNSTVNDMLSIDIGSDDDIVFEDGAMFTLLFPTSQSISINGINFIKITVTGGTSPVLNLPLLNNSDDMIIYENITFVYHVGENEDSISILNEHSHDGFAPAGHVHRYNIPEVNYTPEGTVSATFVGASGQIKVNKTAETTSVVSGVTLNPGTFTANTPTAVTSVTGVAVTSVEVNTGAVLTTASLTKTSSTSTVLTGVSLSSSRVATTTVLKESAPVATVTKKCLTLSIHNSWTSVPETASTYTIAPSTADITTVTYKLETTTGTAVTGSVVSTGNVVQTVTVTAGKAASYDKPSITVVTTSVANDSHTHMTENYTPRGTVDATFSGTEATIIESTNELTSEELR